ncbi:hypothetical protein D3C71_1206780 [compost metagenome]
MPAASTSSGKLTESQVIGALHGFLASAAPELSVQTEARLDAEKHFRADLLVTRGEDRLVIELKRKLLKQSYANAVAQVEQYLLVGGIKYGVLLFLPDAPNEMERLDSAVTGIDGHLVILSPKGANPSFKRTLDGTA